MPTQAAERPQATTGERFPRLSVNMSRDTARALKELAERKGLNITEAVRRAIAVWKFVEDEVERGNKIQIVDHETGEKREVLLLS